jgi:hypothetical protein
MSRIAVYSGGNIMSDGGLNFSVETVQLFASAIFSIKISVAEKISQTKGTYKNETFCFCFSVDFNTNL